MSALRRILCICIGEQVDPRYLHLTDSYNLLRVLSLLLTPHWVYFWVMKRTLLILILTLLLTHTVAYTVAQNFAQPSAPQEVTRLPVLAFDAQGDAAPYRLGVATGLQRALNVIDGVYVPPVGDTLLVAQRFEGQGTLSPEVFAEAYDASALVSGVVEVSGGQAQVQIIFAGPDYPAPRVVTVNGALGAPEALLTSITNTVIGELGLSVSAQDREQVDAVLAQTPPLENLSAVAEASLGLQTSDASALETVLGLETDSSWVLSEQAEILTRTDELESALSTSLAAIQSAPEDAEALVTRGAVLLASGDEATAQTAFEAALLLNPAHALALAGLGRLQDDVANLEAALGAYPRYVPAYLDLASAQDAQGDAQAALATLERGVANVPDSTILKRAFLSGTLDQGGAQDALSYLQGALTEGTPAADLYALAAELPSEVAPQALEIVREGRSAYPQDASLALAEASLLSQTGDVAAAESVLQEAQGVAPDNLRVTNELAIAQARQGNLDEARATLENASQTNNTVQLNLAQILLEAGQADGAIELLEPLLSASPQDAELYSLYGVALGRAGRYDQALNALDEALVLDPNLTQAQEARQIIAQNQALTQGEPIELEPEAASLFSTGLAALEADDASAAEQSFTQALELQNSGLLAFYQGYARQLQGDLRDAATSYEQALEELDDSAPVLNNLGFAYFRLGRFDRAIEYLERAVAADPENAEAQLNLGLIYYDLERFAQAVGPLEQAVQLRPELAETSVQVGAEEQLGFTELLEQARSQAQ